jgi:DHA2 family multidrug resistance protein
LQSHGSDAKAMALKQLMQMTHTQGLVMAFADVFFLLMLLFVALAALAVIIKKPPGLHGA